MLQDSNLCIIITTEELHVRTIITYQAPQKSIVQCLQAILIGCWHIWLLKWWMCPLPKLLLLPPFEDRWCSWYPESVRLIFQLVIAILPAPPSLLGADFCEFLVCKNIQGGYRQLSVNFESLWFNSPHFCLNSFSLIYSCSYARQLLSFFSVN